MHGAPLAPLPQPATRFGISTRSVYTVPVRNVLLSPLSMARQDAYRTNTDLSFYSITTTTTTTTTTGSSKK